MARRNYQDFMKEKKRIIAFKTKYSKRKWEIIQNILKIGNI